MRWFPAPWAPDSALVAYYCHLTGDLELEVALVHTKQSGYLWMVRTYVPHPRVPDRLPVLLESGFSRSTQAGKRTSVQAARDITHRVPVRIAGRHHD